jgi:hypothetical protein
MYLLPVLEMILILSVMFCEVIVFEGSLNYDQISEIMETIGQKG